MEHTPGPWKVVSQGGVIEVQANTKTPIVSWQGFDDSDRSPKEHLANARLIASAPQMAAELARLQAIEAAARDVLPTIAWWSDGYDDGAVYRCVGCDVERDDVQSGADKHHESCRVGKLIAALGAKP